MRITQAQCALRRSEQLLECRDDIPAVAVGDISAAAGLTTTADTPVGSACASPLRAVSAYDQSLSPPVLKSSIGIIQQFESQPTDPSRSLLRNGKTEQQEGVETRAVVGGSGDSDENPFMKFMLS